METQTWCKPIIASIFVVGLAILVLWFFVWNVIDDLKRKINNVFGFATGLVDLMFDYFNDLFQFTLNKSEVILERLKLTIEKINKILNKIQSPAFGLTFSNFLNKKINIGYKKGEELNQHDLNVIISNLVTNQRAKMSIINALDGLDHSIFNNSVLNVNANIVNFVSNLISQS